MDFELANSGVGFPVYHNAKQRLFVLVSFKGIGTHYWNYLGFFGHNFAPELQIFWSCTAKIVLSHSCCFASKKLLSVLWLLAVGTYFHAWPVWVSSITAKVAADEIWYLPTSLVDVPAPIASITRTPTASPHRALFRSI